MLCASTVWIQLCPIHCLWIFAGGYVPGERIPFTVTVENRSSRKVRSLTLHFVQRIVFRTSCKSTLRPRYVQQLESPMQIGPRATTTWNGEFPVPAVCATSNGTCRLIEVSYALLLSVKLKCAISENLTIPITIGTIPLQPAGGVAQPQPSYESCAFGPTEIAGLDRVKGDVIENNQNSFVPQYPVYKYTLWREIE